MEIGRKYEYDPDFLPVLYNWLNLEPGMLAVDVGCGSGYFIVCGNKVSCVK